MIAELFLSCALALPACNFHNGGIIDEVKQLRDFVKKSDPVAQIIVMVPDRDLSGRDMERLPFKWHGMSVWIKHCRAAA